MSATVTLQNGDIANRGDYAISAVDGRIRCINHIDNALNMVLCNEYVADEGRWRSSRGVQVLVRLATADEIAATRPAPK